MRKLFTAVAATGALALTTGPAYAGHDHFVYIERRGVCQYVAHGQTSIDDPDHGGYHRFHDEVHQGTPGRDARGNDVDKASEVDGYDCTERGRR